MGEFAADVGDRLRDSLAAAFPEREWRTEHYVGGTPVDVASPGDPTVLVELEWRRADPSDNTAKLFRHLWNEEIGAAVVCQVFTRYYELRSGEPNSKRRNAEFVGRRVARSFDRVRYHAVEFDLNPPKRGGERPDRWRDVADETAAEIATLVRDE